MAGEGGLTSSFDICWVWNHGRCHKFIELPQEVGHTRRASGIERLMETLGIDPGANRVRADDGHGLALADRRGDEARDLARRVGLN
ncbi:MAG: hypothetical protein EXS31_07100 [Pedosphaera sp.]|nr:hypothetical protein [Pedosphaera sp.]